MECRTHEYASNTELGGMTHSFNRGDVGGLHIVTAALVLLSHQLKVPSATHEKQEPQLNRDLLYHQFWSIQK